MRIKFHVLLVMAFSVFAENQQAAAQPVTVEPFKERFEAARKDAEVLATVQVLAVSCNELTINERPRTVRLQLSLLVLEKQKGIIKPGEMLVVGHTVPLPTGSGPGLQPYLAAARQFPITPGVKGQVALRWNEDVRQYAPIAGWVSEPNNTAIPKELGQVFTWNDMSKLRIGMLREEVIKILGPPQKVDNSVPNGGVALTFNGLELTFRSDRLEGALLRLEK